MGRGKSLFWAPGFAPLNLVISVSSANPRSFFYRLWNLHFGAGFRKLFDPLASFLSFDDDALFLKLVSSSFLQQPPPRGAAMFHVPCRRQEGALGAERRCARISPQFAYSSSSVFDEIFSGNYLLRLADWP